MNRPDFLKLLVLTPLARLFGGSEPETVVWDPGTELAPMSLVSWAKESTMGGGQITISGVLVPVTPIGSDITPDV